jgi:protein-tyrosine phosphatase
MSAPVPPLRRAAVVSSEAVGDQPYRIVFVCTGNICRSPMAEVITRTLAESTRLGDGTRLADHLEVRSAGTGPWHEGEPMHAFAASALERAGYPRHAHVAHQVNASELDRIDLIVALDRRHQQTLRGLGADPDRMGLLRSFDTGSGAAADVPDPYYGDDAVFDECRDMIASACAGLVATLADQWDALSVASPLRREGAGQPPTRPSVGLGGVT